MPDPAPITDALGKLRARCEAAGLTVVDCPHDLSYLLSPKHEEVQLPEWTLQFDDDNIQAAHWLLDGYERRDCECEDGYKQYGISPYGRVYIKCPNCQGRVPPGVGE